MEEQLNSPLLRSGGLAERGRVCNLANCITLIRLALLPLIAFFYFSTSFLEYGKLIALVLFVIAVLTDFLDGWIARRFNMVTDLGKLLDPIADKLLTFLGFALVFTDITLLGILYPIWFAVMVFFIATMRDYILNLYRQLAGAKGKVMAADWSSKIKSTVQYIGISFAMVYAYCLTTNCMNESFELGMRITTIILLSLATALTLISLASHTRHFINVK